MSSYELCQSHNFIGEHAWWMHAWHRFQRTLGVRGQWRRRHQRYPLGEPSRYAVGDWVRVCDKETIQKTLDAQSRLRGLVFLPGQWDYCGGIYRVQKIVQCVVSDQALFRPVSRTILLEGVLCSGPTRTGGCGRHCPLLFRDEWLEPASAPLEPPRMEPAAPPQYVYVRPANEIQATLDRQGKRDGLMFMPEMYQWSGRRFRVLGQVPKVYEFGVFKMPSRPVYILEGLHCSGAILGRKGPCQMGCSFLWHADWVRHDS